MNIAKKKKIFFFHFISKGFTYYVLHIICTTPEEVLCYQSHSIDCSQATFFSAHQFLPPLPYLHRKTLMRVKPRIVESLSTPLL